MIRRLGSTLIELVLSMSAGSVVMLLAISLVHQTMTLSERSRHRSDDNRVLDQLAQRFRSDVHLALNVDTDANASNALTIKVSDGSTVTYVAKNCSVVRERKNALSGNEQERFVLADAGVAIFQKLSNPTRASIIVSHETGLQGTGLQRIERNGVLPRVDLSVQAIVGRWLTLEHTWGDAE